MADVPAMPFFVDDYLSSQWVMTCDLKDEAIYFRLLMFQWKHTSCSLPDDMAFLRKLCKGARAARIQAVLTENFQRIETEKGRFVWRNARNFYEFMKVLERSEQARNAANTRYNKHKHSASALPEHMPERYSTPASISKTISITKKDLKEGDFEMAKKREQWAWLSQRLDDMIAAEKIAIPDPEIRSNLFRALGLPFQPKTNAEIIDALKARTREQLEADFLKRRQPYKTSVG